MQTRKLGRFEVSLVGLGTNNFGARIDEERARAVVAAALDVGITFFDTADIYGGGRSEEYLGRALGSRRDDVVIATKFGMQMGDDPARAGGSARWIATAVEDSLRRLGTDRIDLYQLHRPDPETPIAETLEVFDRLVEQGKVLEIGNSNFSGAQIEEAEGVSRARGLARFVSAQNHYNLLAREPEGDVLPACEAHGLGFLPYFPLASGLLTGKYRRGEPAPDGTRLATVPAERAERILSERNFDVVERLEAIARERGRTTLDVAIGWLAARPLVASVIAGATRPEQVRANAAAGAWVPAPEDLAAIEAALAA